jgi:hypothetical protein
MEQVEFNELIANRQAPGDNWVLVGDSTNTVYNSLTEVLEVWFDKNQEKAEFRLSPLDSKIYVIRTENKKPEPPKRYNIYGDY